MPRTTYIVYYTYSKKYDRSRMLSGTLEWSWTAPPRTWEDFEPVRTFIKKTDSACRVMLYAVMSDADLELYKGVRNFLYQNGSRKRGLYKPWEDHDSSDTGRGSGDSRELAGERGADEPTPVGTQASSGEEKEDETQ